MEKMSKYAFKSGVEYYLRQIQKDPIHTTLPGNLTRAGFSNPDFKDKLLKKGIISQKETLKNDGAAQFQIQYHINDNPEQKIKALYDEIYSVKESVFKDEDNMKKEILKDKQLGYAYKTRGGIKLDETDCGGCLQGGGENPGAGEYETPVFGIVKRKVYISEKQAEKLKKHILDEEGVVDTGFGGGFSFGYDANALSINQNDEAYDHSNMFKKSKKK